MSDRTGNVITPRIQQIISEKTPSNRRSSDTSKFSFSDDPVLFWFIYKILIILNIYLNGGEFFFIHSLKFIIQSILFNGSVFILDNNEIKNLIFSSFSNIQDIFILSFYIYILNIHLILMYIL